MNKKQEKKYKKGLEDVERVFDHLDSKEREARKEAWLRENYPQRKLPEKEK